jgi:hypothetical protein
MRAAQSGPCPRPAQPEGCPGQGACVIADGPRCGRAGRAEPGSVLARPVREFCRTWPDQAEVTVPGIQFVQDDSGPEIGQAIAAWLWQLAH